MGQGSYKQKKRRNCLQPGGYLPGFQAELFSFPGLKGTAGFYYADDLSRAGEEISDHVLQRSHSWERLRLANMSLFTVMGANDSIFGLLFLFYKVYCQWER